MTKSSWVSFFVRINLMVVHFCLNLIFWIKYYHIRNFITINRLCLLINIMFIIMFVITYACFPIFLSIYCNAMLATIKRGRRWRLNYILSLSEKLVQWKLTDILIQKKLLTFWSSGNLLIFWSNGNVLTFWSDPMKNYWHFGPMVNY